MKYLIILFFTLLTTELLYGQKTYQFGNDIEVWTGEKLSMPFAGGLNAAQIQKMDVTGNGLEELVIWDINAGSLKIFQQGDDEFLHLPDATFHFPNDISGFLILEDYDGDGKKDLFTGSPFGIKAYKNISPTGSKFPEWETAQDFLRLENGANLTANPLDIPLIQDLDGDGDLDILTFNFATGDYLEFYKNTSQERKEENDIDGFSPAIVRWGAFEFCDCGQINFGFTCEGFPINQAKKMENHKVQHSGGHSLLYRDFTGDGVRDLLIGQDECTTLYFLENKGSDPIPQFDGFTTSIPGAGPFPEFPIFHAAYPIGEDLIVTTNSSESSFNFDIDYSQSLYRMSLVGGPLIKTRSFLQEEMLDFGENGRPSFEGTRMNGNLVITANRLSGGEVLGKAFHFILTDNGFQLATNDYLNLSQLQLTELSHQFFQSSQGKKFHIVTGDEYRNNIPTKKMFYSFRETPEELQPFSLPDFTLRGLDQLHFFHDGEKDYMLLARQTGELVLFSAQLEDGIVLELMEENYLEFSDNPVSRGLSVAVDSGPIPELMAIDQRGVLMNAIDFMSDGEKHPVAMKIGEDIFSESRFGRNSWITFIPGIFEDSPGLLIGTRAGGVEYLKSVNQETPGQVDNLKVLIYPNPAEDEVKIISNRDVNLTIVDLSGKIVHEHLNIPGGSEKSISLFGLNPGLYILEITDHQQNRIYKKLLVNP
ncbi:MAG: T9SS type A sorting domain-containing protein [Cyclobacteriaceae bacterium]